MSIFSKDLIQDEEYINKIVAAEKLRKMLLDAAIQIDKRPKNSTNYVIVSPSIDNPEHVSLIGYDCDAPMYDCAIKSSFTIIK